jgi:hypothetical protein
MLCKVCDNITCCLVMLQHCRHMFDQMTDFWYTR